MKSIHLNAGKITGMLGWIISALLVVNLLIIYLHFVRGYQHMKGFIQGFYFDHEANFPSFYSAMAIFFCAMLLWLIATSDREKTAKRSAYWKLLCFVFIFLGLDEFGSFHEYLIQPVHSVVDESAVDSGYLYFAWFIPYTILALIIGAILLRFLLRLPAQTRFLFIFGGLVFLAGAVGMEMVSGNYWAAQGWAIDGSDPVDLRYALMTTLEELLEMVGILIFIYALLSYYLSDKREHVYMVKIADTIAANEYGEPKLAEKV